jgi:MFS family permease
MADLLGPRRVFTAGLVLFGVTSLVAGLSNSPEFLIGARAVQGLGGALLSPSALAILTMTFAHGRERNIAMGVWGGWPGSAARSGLSPAGCWWIR